MKVYKWVKVITRTGEKTSLRARFNFGVKYEIDKPAYATAFGPLYAFPTEESALNWLTPQHSNDFEEHLFECEAVPFEGEFKFVNWLNVSSYGMTLEAFKLEPKDPDGLPPQSVVCKSITLKKLIS